MGGVQSFLFLAILFFCGVLGTTDKFSKEGYVNISSQAMEANDVLIKDIMSRKCHINIDFRRGEVSFNPPISHQQDRFGRILTQGRVCVVHIGTKFNKPALLTAVDNLSELEHGSLGWQNFLNKASFAVEHDRSFYLWVGRLPKESRETFISDRDTLIIPWFKCAELRDPMDGVSMYKVLAISTLFQLPNPPTKVLFLENSMFLPLDSKYKLFHDVDQNFDDPSIFLIGDSDGEGGRMTAGMLGVKNSDDAKRFLAMWWQLQCGLRDEHSLYMMMVFYSFSLGQVEIAMKALGLANFEQSNKGANAYYEIKKNLLGIRNATGCQSSQRAVTTRTPPPDHPFFPYHHQLFVEDPVCGIVASIAQQNGICQCEIGECEGSCADRWPPPHPDENHFEGREEQYEQMWSLEEQSFERHRKARTRFL